MIPNSKLVGKRIRKLRKHHHITLAELAEYLDVSTVHVNRIELGTVGMSIRILVDIAEYFNVTADYLLFGDPAMYPENLRPTRYELELIQRVRALPDDEQQFFWKLMQKVL